MGRATLSHMRIVTAQLAAVLILGLALNATVDAQARKKKAAAPAQLPCGDLVGFQVRLDRQGFSSGQIDGTSGANFSRTLSAFQTAHKLPVGKPDCATWEALGAGSPEPAIASYTVTDEDVNALRSRYSEDQLFEIVVSAAFGAARERLAAARRALEEA